MLKRFASLAGIFLLAAIWPWPVLAQESVRPFSEVGIGVKASLLGAGLELATPLAHRFNLRAGFNALSYDRGFHKDGILYAGQLNFRSTEAHLDWFPFGGSFHVSPGALVYNGNRINANASVPGGQSFTLNGTAYTSDPTDPITGAGKLDFKEAGPMLTVGFGNLLPRNHHHFSIPVEIGAIYTGAPRTALALTGSVCDSTGLICENTNADPTFQANVQEEQAKISKDVSAFKFYPLLSVGFGVKF